MSKFATSCTPRAQSSAVEGSIASCAVPDLCHLYLVWGRRNLGTSAQHPVHKVSESWSSLQQYLLYLILFNLPLTIVCNVEATGKATAPSRTIVVSPSLQLSASWGIASTASFQCARSILGGVSRNLGGQSVHPLLGQ